VSPHTVDDHIKPSHIPSYVLRHRTYQGTVSFHKLYIWGASAVEGFQMFATVAKDRRQRYSCGFFMGCRSSGGGRNTSDVRNGRSLRVRSLCERAAARTGVVLVGSLPRPRPSCSVFIPYNCRCLLPSIGPTAILKPCFNVVSIPG